jgi:type I restriction enzyme, R subunit
MSSWRDARYETRYGFNPRYSEKGRCPAAAGFRHLHTDIYGNPPSPVGYGGTGREFVEHLRNPPSPKGYGGTGRGKFFDPEEKRERDLILSSSEFTRRNYPF